MTLIIVILVPGKRVIPFGDLVKMSGTIKGDCLAAAMDQGGSPITYLFVQLFKGDDLVGLAVIGAIYFVCMIAVAYDLYLERTKA